jgi:hypothetical protein
LVAKKDLATKAQRQEAAPRESFVFLSALVSWWRKKILPQRPKAGSGTKRVLRVSFCLSVLVAKKDLATKAQRQEAAPRESFVFLSAFEPWWRKHLAAKAP